ncbi:MAG: iron-sulfur cluster assembly scaffold protein [Isosphaeraceae bacterium]
MDDILYREEILERYHEAPHRGRLAAPDRSAEVDNPLCGDRILLELALGPEGRIVAVRFDGDGCVISQVAASYLAEHLEGRPVDEALGFSADEAIGLLGIPLSPARRKCGVLAWRALQRALAATAEPTAAGPDAHPPLLPPGQGHHHDNE